jgi:cytoskeletal protein CcmA (bactofilin family)
VSEKGRVKGEIHAPNVIINGKVYGDIHSDKHIELAARAEVKGNVYYNLIEMVMGSRVDGNLVHVNAGKDIHEGKREGALDSTGQVAEEVRPTTVSAVQTRTA